MYILVLPKEKYPTNRPMLVELWGKQICNSSIKLLWIMQSDLISIGLKKKKHDNNCYFILPRIGGGGIIAKGVNRIINFSGKMILSYFLCVKHKICVIHVHCGPEEGLISLILSKIKRISITYAYTSHFLLIQPSLHGKTAALKKKVEHLKFSFRKILYKIILERADLVFPISALLKKQLVNDMNIPAYRMHTIPECAGSIFLDHSRSSNLSTSKRIRIVYIGSLGRTRNIPFIIDTFEIVQRNIENAELILIGWGHDRRDIPYLKKYAAKKDSIASRIIFRDPIPYQKIPEAISKYDIGLSFIPPTARYVFATPTKCIEYMSLKIPVVANKEIPDQCHVVSSANAGILTNYHVNDAAKGILKLTADSHLRKKYGENGYKWIKKNRTFELIAPEIVKKLKDLYNCQ